MIFGHIGDGNLDVFILQPQSLSTEKFHRLCKQSDQTLFSFVAQHHGSVSAEHGIGLLKKDALPFTRSPREIELIRWIKRGFDPEGLLNPGKIISTH